MPPQSLSLAQPKPSLHGWTVQLDHLLCTDSQVHISGKALLGIPFQESTERRPCLIALAKESPSRMSLRKFWGSQLHHMANCDLGVKRIVSIIPAMLQSRKFRARADGVHAKTKARNMGGSTAWGCDPLQACHICRAVLRTVCAQNGSPLLLSLVGFVYFCLGGLPGLRKEWNDVACLSRQEPLETRHTFSRPLLGLAMVCSCQFTIYNCFKHLKPLSLLIINVGFNGETLAQATHAWRYTHSAKWMSSTNKKNLLPCPVPTAPPSSGSELNTSEEQSSRWSDMIGMFNILWPNWGVLRNDSVQAASSNSGAFEHKQTGQKRIPNDSMILAQITLRTLKDTIICVICLGQVVFLGTLIFNIKVRWLALQWRRPRA